MGVAVSGNYAYIADGPAGLQVIDISYPRNPVRVGGYDTAGFAYGVTVRSNHAYVADGTAGLQVIDISNPANPVRVGGYDTGGNAFGVSAIWSNYLGVADGNGGLLVLDVSDPTNPKRVGGHDTSGTAWGVAMWDDHALVADAEGGLQIFRVIPDLAPVWRPPIRFSAEGFEAWLEIKVPGRHRIDVSKDFQRWKPWLTLTNASGRIRVLDRSANNAALKFYRVVKE
jgi:hypothetical protein